MHNFMCSCVALTGCSHKVALCTKRTGCRKLRSPSFPLGDSEKQPGLSFSLCWPGNNAKTGCFPKGAGLLSVACYEPTPGQRKVLAGSGAQPGPLCPPQAAGLPTCAGARGRLGLCKCHSAHCECQYSSEQSRTIPKSCLRVTARPGGLKRVQEHCG